MVSVIPQKAIVQGILLGHPFTIGTQNIAENLINNRLHHLVDSTSFLPVSVSESSSDTYLIRYEGEGKSSDILRSAGLPRNVDIPIDMGRVDDVLSNKSVKEWVLQGVKQRDARMYQNAEESFRNALLFDSTNSNIWHELAYSIGNQGKWIESEVYFVKALDYDDLDDTLWVNYAIALSYGGKSRQAITALNTALSINPTNQNAKEVLRKHRRR
jgi:tetratricopeptide (TPR) repeat protein